MGVDDLVRIKEVYELIQQEVSEYIVGRNPVLQRMFEALLAGGHVLIEGVPGTAKTYLAKAFAGTLNLTFRRVQLTPDLLPSDIVGSLIYNQQKRSFEFREGPIFTNVLLADELNRTPPKTQAALLQAMQEYEVNVAGYNRKLPLPFMVIATENPIESEGVYPLPEAELDRFLYRVVTQYPTLEEEIQVLKKKAIYGEELGVKQVISGSEILRLRAALNTIKVEEPVIKYMVNLVRATRDATQVLLGASTRAVVHLFYASRAHAAVDEGRNYVIPDDVQEVFPDVINHRLILRPEVIIGSYSREPLWTYNTLMKVVRGVIESVPVPR